MTFSINKEKKSNNFRPFVTKFKKTFIVKCYTERLYQHIGVSD